MVILIFYISKIDPIAIGSRSDPKIAIREKNGSRSWGRIVIGFFPDRDLGVGSRSGKILDRDRDPIANSNTKISSYLH
jgi:hypothetical protein